MGPSLSRVCLTQHFFKKNCASMCKALEPYSGQETATGNGFAASGPFSLPPQRERNWLLCGFFVPTISGRGQNIVADQSLIIMKCLYGKDSFAFSQAKGALIRVLVSLEAGLNVVLCLNW